MHHCPNATLVIHHLHVTQAINDVVDAVRKAAGRTPDGGQRRRSGSCAAADQAPRRRSKRHSRVLHCLIISSAELLAPRGLQNVLAFVEPDLTDAFAGDTNRIVTLVRSRTSGCRNPDTFTNSIRLVRADFAIPAHLPSNLRTL